MLKRAGKSREIKGEKKRDEEEINIRKRECKGEINGKVRTKGVFRS